MSTSTIEMVQLVPVVRELLWPHFVMVNMHEIQLREFSFNQSIDGCGLNFDFGSSCGSGTIKFYWNFIGQR